MRITNTRVDIFLFSFVPHSLDTFFTQATQLAKIALRAGAGGMVNGLLRAVATNQVTVVFTLFP